MIGLIGTGAVSLTLAALLSQAELDFCFLARPSERGARMKTLLEGEGLPILASEAWQGLKADRVQGPVHGLEILRTQKFETLFLAVPHCQFASVLENLGPNVCQNLVLLNSGLGCELELASWREKSTHLAAFSNFFGAAKVREGVLSLRALKKKVYLGGTRHWLSELLNSLGVEVESLGSVLEAELRNITLYVHTVLGLAPYSLESVLGLVDTPRYLYKLYPEGPLERTRTRLYAQFFGDVMKLVEALGLSPFNLLSFLHHDNYPVPECFLSEAEVQAYPSSPRDRQGDLLYARYTGLLVDPNSSPDKAGRYSDFSAVPILRAKWRDGGVELPRVQAEEISNLALLREMGRKMALELHAVEEIWSEVRSVGERLESQRRSAFFEVLAKAEERAYRLARSWSLES